MDSLSSYKYKHIFFDLDHTLWDFEGNSRLTLAELFMEFNLQGRGVPSVAKFIDEYERVNAALWRMYREGDIEKLALRNTRFIRVFQHWQIDDDELASEINEHYLTEGPKKNGLLPNALITLEYLQRRYGLHLITNGFKEVQHTKLSGSGLLPFFETITTSEETGYLKPDRRVFEIALKSARAVKGESIHVGDHYETDILGAKRAKIDQVYYNPKHEKVEEKPTFDIADLIELTSFL